MTHYFRFNFLSVRINHGGFSFIFFLLLIIGANRNYAQLLVPAFDSTWFGYNTQVSNQPYFLSSAKLIDLDNDGDSDVVASKYFGGFMGSAKGFVVLKNNGEGLFNSTPAHYNSPETSQFVETADFNNDSFLDVVVSNSGEFWDGNSISVFMNDGDGTFGSPATYTVGIGAAGIVVADFNDDGNIDLAVANYGTFGSQNTIRILLNTGGGAFSPAVSYPAGDSPYRIEAAKINLDDFIDLVVANENGFLNVLLNSGTGNFSNRTEYSVSQTSNGLFPSVWLADIDNDSDQDILYTNLNLFGIELFRNLGNSFSTPETIQSNDFSGGIMDIETADLNADGWLDIVATSTTARTTDGYQVFINNSSGGFLEPYRNPAGQNTVDIMLGDVDSDGWVDILTADSYSMQITVHKNYGQATFPIPHLFDTGSSIAGSLDAADIDGDGDLDVVTSASGRAAIGVTVKVQINLGNGIFGEGVSYSIRGGGVQAKFRNLNGDSFPDLLFATAINSPPYDFHYAINNGDGTFGTVQTKSIGSCGWYDIDAFDIDNDGDEDVLITEWLGCPNVTNSSMRLFICLNDGNASFADPLIEVIGPGVAPIAAGDFNSDGKIDIATGTAGALINISIGNGNGDFNDPVNYSIGSQGGATDIVVADFNGDDILDIASSNFWESTTMSVLIGNGDGTFQPANIIPSAYSPDLLNVSGITVGDVDSDGDADIMVGNNASNCISLYENNNGVFTYRVRIGGYSGVFSPLFADFDGDDRGDLVAVGQLPPSGIPSTLMFIKGVTTGGIPVELTSFTATVTRNSVSLNWQTATELNNSRFEIERKQVGSPQSSVGNQEWNVIAFVPGFGTTTEPKSYSFADENLSAGKYQYRLKQIDFDGTFEYSNAIEVEITTLTEFSLEQNYPNPFNPTTLITFGLQEKSIVSLKVFNLIGEEVALLLNEEKAAGVHTLTFNSESLPSGVYFYKLQAGSFTQTKKMILLR